VATWYAGLGLYDVTVNAGVDRFTGQGGDPLRTLTAPLLTLHTTMDPDVPFFHEAALAKIVATARSSKWLAQQSVQRYGHCNVTPAETLITLGRLVNWAEKGVKPASGDVTLQLAIESPESTTSSVVSTVTTELTFMEAILGATAGLPLPGGGGCARSENSPGNRWGSKAPSSDRAKGPLRRADRRGRRSP
jgi:hypothetical protein